MRFYERRVFPWINDKLTASPELNRIRGEALATARGVVVEIGFGSGSHLTHYPIQVRSIVAVEPNDGMHDLAASRIRASPIPVLALIGQGESLPLPDHHFDTAVSILTLCSVSDPSQVLRELRRVLRKDGQLILVEHGLSQDPGVARWQNRLNSFQKVIACGCHLNRAIVDLVEGGGFRVETLRRFYAARIPRTHGWITTGTARPL